MRPRWLVPSLLALALASAAPVAGAEAERIEIPEPALEGLEPAVAAELAETRRQVLDAIASGPLPMAEIGESYGELGRLYHAYDLLGPAEACYRAAAATDTGDFRWPYYLASVLSAEGRLEEAAAGYESVLALRPEEMPARVHLGEVYFALGRLDEAEAALAPALDAGPFTAAARAVLGQVALSRRDYRGAVKHLEAALEAFPQANRLYYPLAQAYRGLGAAEEAGRLLGLKGEVGLKPPDPLIDQLEGLAGGERIRLLRGRAAFRAGRFERAAEEFRGAVEADPDSVRARVNLGTALGQAGDLDAAIAEFERALALDPDSRAAHFNLGTIHASRGELDRALAHLQAASDGDQDDGEAHFEVAEVLRRLGRFQESVGHYAAAIRLTPPGEMARLGGAQSLVSLGRYRDALAGLEKGLELLPESGLLAHALARLLASCPDAELRDGERALDLGQRVFDARPTVLHAETLALALAELGRCDEAAEWQRQALEGAGEQAGAERMAEMNASLSRYRTPSSCRPPLGEPADPR